VNGEADYKAQSLQLSSAPLLLENQEKGDYTIYLKPEITLSNMSFNVTHPDLDKRRVFVDLRFRQAMSLAINRQEINDVALFGQGTPKQYTGFSPLPDFVDKKWENYMIDYNPGRANSLLDQIGMKDKDGDGFRELPSGKKLVINMNFSTQGIDPQIVEMVGQNWAEVGIQTTVKEVTPDEYRSAQSSNQLDVGMWRSSQPLSIVMGNNELWVPPFENYFGHRTGMLWAEYVDSNGSKGVKPPAYVMQLIDDVNKFQSSPIGSSEFKRLGQNMVKNMTENLLKIGIAQKPAPIYRKNSLKNFVEFKTHSYEYYRTYPYRATQWYLDE
jgi:peptide/nickel transport system substrate-binding protein